MNGELNTNDAALNNRFALYSTPGNAVIYLDYVRANSSATVTEEKGGLMAISVDELTKTKRTVYYGDTHKQLDGSAWTTFDGDWANIDNAVGFVGKNNKKFGFGDKANNNSVNTAKIYPMYAYGNRNFSAGDIVDRRNMVYYSNITAEKTQQMCQQLQVLTDKVPNGWNGVIAADPDGTQFLFLSNFVSDVPCKLSDIACEQGAPVFSEPTTINNGKSSATFLAEQNHAVGNTLKFFLTGDGIKAIQAKNDSSVVFKVEGDLTDETTQNQIRDEINSGVQLFQQFYTSKLYSKPEADKEQYQLGNFTPYAKKVLIETLESYIGQNESKISTPYVQNIVQQTNDTLASLDPLEKRYEETKNRVPHYDRNGQYAGISAMMYLLYGMFFGLFVAMFHYTSKKTIEEFVPSENEETK
jgi:hypothetical protein